MIARAASNAAPAPWLKKKQKMPGRTLFLLGSLLAFTTSTQTHASTAPATKLPATSVQMQTELLSPAQLKADVASLQQFIAATHPDIRHSADPAQLQQAFEQIEVQLTTAKSATEFWLLTARLNPLFNDAHWSVNLPAAAADLTALAKTSGLFPLEVQLRPDGELTVLAEAGGKKSRWQGAVIQQINGVSAAQIGRDLLALRHGDTPLNRANLLGPAFQLFYASKYGSPAQYELALEQQGKLQTVTLPASREISVIGKTPVSFADNFHYKALAPQAAYMKIGSFDWEDDKAVAAFTKETFGKIKASGATTLIIDVRENRGGNDSVWIEHLLPYLADQAFRVGSFSRKKVIASRASQAEPAGLVIDSEFKTWYPADLDHPLRFQGQVFVLIGRRTYSSAVQFSNVMQDFGFATLVGEGSYVRSRSTGGIQFYQLPHSKLQIIVPRFWAARPSGGSTAQLLTPDWLLPDDVQNPDALIDALVGAVAAKQQRLIAAKTRL